MLAVIVSRVAQAGIFFQDGFETGNLGHTENGARWGASNGHPNQRPSVTSEWAKTGTYSLKFPYAAGRNSWSEQRFDFGGAYSDIWVKFDLYIPSNYVDGSGEPSNNKFLIMDDYVEQEFTDFETWGTNDHFKVQRKWNGTNHGWITPQNPSMLLSDGPGDLGQWHEFVFHVKKESAPGAGDGVYEAWKNGVKRIDLQNQQNYSSASNGLQRGYLLGWANSGFGNPTTFYMDNVVFSDSPLFEVPNPPILQPVQ